MTLWRTAQTEYPIHDLLARRWSPYRFSTEPVSEADLVSLFTAAAWAASSFNEQPWRYVVGRRTDASYRRILSCLNETNRIWAGHAPVLALGIARLDFARNGKPNRVAPHDLGAASASLTFEATARGIAVHQMAGLDIEGARTEFSVPDNFQVVTGIAIGYAARQSDLPEDVAAKDSRARQRRALEEFVFSDVWGRAVAWLPE